MRLLLTTLLMLAAGVARAAPPIVAVFDVQAPLPARSRSALTELIGTQLVASGHYRILPRAQIKRRLVQLRRESYKDCYDRSCQIEIGRELSAQKSLATRISRIGGQCMLTLVLHDLNTETAEAAETVRTSCDEQALVVAAESATRALALKAPGSAQRHQPPASQPEAELSPRVSLFVRSSPPQAEVLVDGHARGTTPTKLALLRGRSVILDLVKDGYQQARRQVVGGEQVALDVQLELTEARRLEQATAAEWGGVGVGAGFMSGKVGLGLSFRLLTLKWRSLFWTVGKVDLIMLNKDDQSFSTKRDVHTSVVLASRAGYPIYLGERGEHQVLLGAGAAAMVNGTAADDRALFGLLPGVDYVYNASGGLLPCGFGLHAFLPLHRHDDSYAAAFLFTLNIGLSLQRYVGRGRAMQSPR